MPFSLCTFSIFSRLFFQHLMNNKELISFAFFPSLQYTALSQRNCSKALCNSMNPFVFLPEELYLVLRDYLSSLDYFYFISCNKCYFREIRRQTVQFCLDRELSHSFFHNDHFRLNILTQVRAPNAQIFVHYSNKQKIPIKFEIFDLVCGITFDDSTEDSLQLLCDQLPKFKNISQFSSKFLESFPYLPNLQQVSIRLSQKLYNLQNLRNMMKLQIESCDSVTDIQDLANIPELSIIACPNITDFSCLGKQKFLRISDCPGLRSVETFRNVPHLFLAECCNVIDISPLKSIFDLSITNMSQIQDISSLGGHFRLALVNCHPQLIGFEEIFPSIPHLSISSPSIQMLDSGHYSLSLFEVDDSIQDFSFLCPNTFSLAIYESYTLHQVLPSQIHCFQHLSSLGVFACSLETADGLGEIGDVCFEYCESLMDISGLGRNHTVRLLSCDQIEDVSSLGTVLNVTIVNCKKIRNEESLLNVPRLRIQKLSSNIPPVGDGNFYHAM